MTWFLLLLSAVACASLVVNGVLYARLRALGSATSRKSIEAGKVIATIQPPIPGETLEERTARILARKPVPEKD